MVDGSTMGSPDLLLFLHKGGDPGLWFFGVEGGRLFLRFHRFLISLLQLRDGQLCRKAPGIPIGVLRSLVFLQSFPQFPVVNLVPIPVGQFPERQRIPYLLPHFLREQILYIHHPDLKIRVPVILQASLRFSLAGKPIFLPKAGRARS